MRARANDHATFAGNTRMNITLGFWHEDRRSSIATPAAILQGLADGRFDQVRPHPAVERFARALIARCCEPAHDCALATGMLAVETSDRHVLVSLEEQGAETLRAWLLALAAEHGVLAFDPRAGAVQRPGAPATPAGVRLRTETKAVVEDPDPAAIAGELARLAEGNGRGFVILERGERHYMQTRRARFGLFVLEFHDGSLERHYEHRRLLPRDEVSLLLQDFAAGCFVSSPLVGWRRIDLRPRRSAGGSEKREDDAQRS